jgi:hypothetical protein
MNGYERFLADPRRAWEERLNPTGPMRELWKALAAARPNPGHEALAALERSGLLRATITQNVDDLHRQAGSEHLLEIHGNATLIRCVQCVARLARDEIDVSELPPRCPHCDGLLKSDTVSFGEPIPPDVLERCYEASERADCVIVAGTSATVYPAAQFPWRWWSACGRRGFEGGRAAPIGSGRSARGGASSDSSVTTPSAGGSERSVRNARWCSPRTTCSGPTRTRSCCSTRSHPRSAPGSDRPRDAA